MDFFVKKAALMNVVGRLKVYQPWETLTGVIHHPEFELNWKNMILALKLMVEIMHLYGPFAFTI